MLQTSGLVRMIRITHIEVVLEPKKNTFTPDLLAKSLEPTCVVRKLNRVDRVHLKAQDLQRQKKNTFMKAFHLGSNANTMFLYYKCLELVELI